MIRPQSEALLGSSRPDRMRANLNIKMSFAYKKYAQGFEVRVDKTYMTCALGAEFLCRQPMGISPHREDG